MRFPLLLFVFLFFASLGYAQPEFGGLPLFLRDPGQYALPAKPRVLPQPDLAKAREKALQNPDNPLFALPLALDFALKDGEVFHLPKGGELYLLYLRVPGVKGLSPIFGDWHLPLGGRLYVSDPQGSHVYGAYTAQNNTQSGRFRTGFVPGEEVVIELYVPPFGKCDPRLLRLDYLFEEPAADKALSAFGFGTSDTCHYNIHCPIGFNQTEVARSVCRVMMTLVEGTGWCSGALVNNTAQDGTPYLLTGFHCQDGYTPLYDLWRFDFEYEAAGCANPAQEPPYLSVLGATLRAGRQASDFLLLETSPVPASYPVYFAGWDRSAAVPDSASLIHHPSADIKKISKDTQALVIHPQPITWNNNVTTPANHHFKAVLDLGSFEPGSSGGPLFNQDNRIVAQLHGGFPGCEQVIIYSGRLFYSWDEGVGSTERLQDWLDPLGTNPSFLDGFDPQAGNLSLSGYVRKEDSTGIAGVRVVLGGDVSDTLWTDSTGFYQFDSLIAGGNYQISCWKDTLTGEGVSTLDMVFISRHILLLDTLDSPYKILASDVNASNSVSTLDLVEIQKVILLLSNHFPNGVSSWGFVRSDWVFPDPINPFSPPPETEISVSNLQVSMEGLDFVGFKRGDVY